MHEWKTVPTGLRRTRTIAAFLAPSVGVSIAGIGRELNRSEPSLWQSVETLTQSAEDDKRLRRMLQLRRDEIVQYANNL